MSETQAKYEELLNTVSATKEVNLIQASELAQDLQDILEGIWEAKSDDGLRMLYKVQDMIETLNPDFDDEDYEDESAEIWEEFVLSQSNKNFKYFITINK